MGRKMGTAQGGVCPFCEHPILLSTLSGCAAGLESTLRGTVKVIVEAAAWGKHIKNFKTSAYQGQHGCGDRQRHPALTCRMWRWSLRVLKNLGGKVTRKKKDCHQLGHWEL